MAGWWTTNVREKLFEPCTPKEKKTERKKKKKKKEMEREKTPMKKREVSKK